MARDWLLVETLGDEPVVIAQGRQMKNMVPLRTFLRRNPGAAAIADAVEDAARTGQGMTRETPGANRAIRTQVVRMSDGRVHGVQVWSGSAAEQPAKRPIPGPAMWDLTARVGMASRESLANRGMDPQTEPTHGRSLADDLPRRGLQPSEMKVLAMAVRCRPGEAFCSTWDTTDRNGNPFTFGFVVRAGLETVADGSEHRIFRSMDWRTEPARPTTARDDLAQRILDGLAQPGTHRALVSLENWTLLKWLDDPCPYYDWHPTDAPVVHPADEPVIAAMTADFSRGAISRVLRLKGKSGGWVRIHVTVNRFALDNAAVAGLISLRLPTETELAESLPPASSAAGNADA
jgi:hypothetical protein